MTQRTDQVRGMRFEPGPVIVGLALITLGVLFLLDQTGTIDAGDLIGDWWPVIIIAIGLAQLAQRRGSPIGPLIVAGFGAILLLTQLDLVSQEVRGYFWPIFLVIAGLAIIFRGPWRNVPSGVGDDVVQASALFGSNELKVTSRGFRGGSVTALFGGVALDLRQANLDPGGATLTATALFGAVDVLVPRGWRAETGGTPIFGGLSNTVEPPGPGEGPTLRVDVVAIFGGVNVKHDK